MLAGATGVELALLVIAADEGVMPQTREHLAILTLLGVRRGVVALTKSDLVEGDWLALVADDVRRLLAGSALDGAEIVACSATTGAGLDELRRAIAAAAARVPSRDAGDLTRLPLDRAFSVKGTGTVVTGTLWSGAIEREATVRLFPGGGTARVRSVESHGAAVGARAARARASRSRSPAWIASRCRTAACSSRTTRHGGSPTCCAPTSRCSTAPRRSACARGCASISARRKRARGSSPRPDAWRRARSIPVRIALDAPIVARAGDRFVLRTASPADDDRRRRRHRPAAARAAREAVALVAARATARGSSGSPRSARGRDSRSPTFRCGWACRPARSRSSSAATRAVVRLGDRVYDVALRSRLRDRLAADVRAWHKANPLEAGLPLQHARSSLRASDELFDDLVRELSERGKIELRGGVLTRAGWKAGSGADAAKLAELALAVDAGGVAPLSVEELADQFGQGDAGLAARTGAGGASRAPSPPDRYYSPRALESLLGIAQARDFRRRGKDGFASP